MRCGSPALRGEQFCYFHQRMVRGVRTPPNSRLHPIALIEDEESIQAALMEVMNALMRNTIDLQRAALVLRALHIAVKNAHRVRFNSGRDTVKDIPEYAAPVAHDFPSETELDPPDTASYHPYEPPSVQEQRRVAKAQQEAERRAEVRASLVRIAESMNAG